MAGGIAQLASYGLADVYLTGSPQITFWKLVYRRHTLFSMEAVQQTFDGSADFGRKATCTIARNGDLVGPVWLEISLPDLLAYDIVAAPGEPAITNTVDVTAQESAAGAMRVYKDPVGNYWRTKTANNLAQDVYTNPVAYYDASSSKYFGAASISGETVTSYNAALFTYYSSTLNATVVTYPAANEIETWPYMKYANNAWSEPDAETYVRWTNSIGHAMLSSVEIEIGGSRIDKHFGEWLDIWSELSEAEEKRAGLWEMIGKYAKADYDNVATHTRAQSRARTYYVPLRFCFNTTPGLYLPLVALTYHQIKYNFEFRPYTELVKAGVQIARLEHKVTREAPTAGINIYADYVFLDAPERIRMAEIQHEYLVTQLQFLGDEAVPAPSDPGGTRNRKYQLNFNHPVRELLWVYVAKSNYEVNSKTGNNWLEYGVPTDSNAEIFDEARLVLNGHDRFSARSAPYFRLIQPYEHHTRCPAKRVHCYSFSLLSPEDHQPSGQANFSRYDTAQLQLTFNANLPTGKIKIFAYSFNVLRVSNGLAGLAFAN